jgi:DNA-binding NarL/FixJ family response regulator
MSLLRLRVGLVDDHAVVRAGYRRFLELAGMEVSFEAADTDAAHAALGRGDDWPIDVLVLDLELPGRSGLDFTRRVRQRWPDARILVFSMHDDPATVAHCLRAGADGFVTKSSDPETLVQAVRDIAQGRRALSPDVQGRLGSLEAAPHTELNTREFDVLNALLEGATLESIASRLNVSQKTVANYQTSIRRKLGVTTALELMAYARRHRLRA